MAILTSRSERNFPWKACRVICPMWHSPQPLRLKAALSSLPPAPRQPRIANPVREGRWIQSEGAPTVIVSRADGEGPHRRRTKFESVYAQGRMSCEDKRVLKKC